MVLKMEKQSGCAGACSDMLLTKQPRGSPAHSTTPGGKVGVGGGT